VLSEDYWWKGILTTDKPATSEKKKKARPVILPARRTRARVRNRARGGKRKGRKDCRLPLLSHPGQNVHLLFFLAGQRKERWTGLTIPTARGRLGLGPQKRGQSDRYWPWPKLGKPLPGSGTACGKGERRLAASLRKGGGMELSTRRAARRERSRGPVLSQGRETSHSRPPCGGRRRRGAWLGLIKGEKTVLLPPRRNGLFLPFSLGTLCLS